MFIFFTCYHTYEFISIQKKTTTTTHKLSTILKQIFTFVSLENSKWLAILHGLVCI